MILAFKDKWHSLWNAELSGENFYLFSFYIVLLVSFLMNTTFMTYLGARLLYYAIYLVIVLLLFKVIIFDQYKIWQLLLLFTVLALAVISWRKSKLIMPLTMTSFIISARDVEFKKIINGYLWVNGILLAGTFLYSLVGIIANLTYYRNEIPRYALGIDYPTDLAAYILFWILAWVYKHYHDLGMKPFLVIFAADILMFLITNARLDALIIAFFLLMICIVKRADKGSIICINTVKTYWGLTLVLPYGYFLLNLFYSSSNRVFNHFNQLLSGRLALGHEGLKRYGITFLGQRVREHGWGGPKGLKMAKYAPWKYFYIDSSYMRLLIIFGACLAVLIVMSMMLISIRSIIRQDYLMPTIILMITISSLIDQHLIEITFNPFLLVLLAKEADKTTKGEIYDSTKKLE